MTPRASNSKISERYHTAIAGFSGWCDAGTVVQNLINHIIEYCEAEELDRWELDAFTTSDHDRPYIKIEHGIVRELSWPAMAFYRLKGKAMDRLLLASGPEPSCNWRSFSREFVDRLTRYGIRRLILLGSLYDQIFHDEVFVSAVVLSPAALNLAKSAGCRLIQYEGPAAVHGALMMEAHANWSIETIAIWSHVPFYLKGPHEKAMIAMLDALSRMTAVNFPHGNLDNRWITRLKQLERLLQEDEELRNLIETLKDQTHQPLRALPGASPPMGGHQQPPKIIHIDDFIKKKRENDTSSEDS